MSQKNFRLGFGTKRPMMRLDRAGYTQRRRTMANAARAMSAASAVRYAVGSAARGRRRVANASNMRVAGFLGIENKFFDSSLAPTTIPAPTDSSGAELDPTTLLCLNCPAQGDGPQARDGRKITMQSLQVSGQVVQVPQTAQTAADAGTTVAVYVILDTQTNAAQLNSEDVFTNPSANAQLATSPFHELENGTRFRTLAKRVFEFEPLPITGLVAGGTIVQSSQTKKFDFFVDLKGMEVNFDKDVTTSVIAAIRDNSIHVVAFSTDAAQPASQLMYNARLRFRG